MLGRKRIRERTGLFKRKRVKKGGLVKEIDFLLETLKGVKSKEKWVKEFEIALRRHRELLDRTGRIIHPKFMEIALLKEQLAKLPDYGDQIRPVYKNVVEKLRKIAQTNPSTKSQVEPIINSLENIDRMMEILAIKFS